MQHLSPPHVRLTRRLGAVAIAAATLCTTALVGAPAAGAGTITQVSACEWPDTAIRAVTFDLGGEATPADAAIGETITLDGATLASTLPWWTIEEAAQFEIAGTAPIVSGVNVIDVNVDVTIQATNVTPARQTLTVPVQVTVNYTPGFDYTEEAQQPHVISVDLDVPDTTWERSGAGAVNFSQRVIVVKARFAPFAGLGYIEVFGDCRPATFNETFDQAYIPPPVFESIPAMPAPRFADVPYTHTFYDDIEWLAQSGITSGYTDGTFRPNGVVNRQAFASFLYNAKGRPAFTPPSTPSFPDVPSGHTFFKAIEWAKAQGVVAGYSDGTFGPTREVARQAAAQWLYKVYGNNAPAPADASFSDVPRGHAFFPAIEWMAAEGITSGLSDGSFGASRTTLRQAVAVWFHEVETS